MSSPTITDAAPPAPPAAPQPGVRTILRRSGVASALVLSLIARGPSTTVGALMALRIGPVHGYTAAGLVDAAFAITLAIASPLWGRLIDRIGPTRPLTVLSLVNAAVMLALGLVPGATAPAVFGLLAVVGGLTEPTHGGAMRGLWDRLLPDEAERHVGFALEAALIEALFAMSTVVFIGGFAAFLGPAAGLVAGGVVAAVFGCWFVWLPAARAWRAEPGDDDDRSGGVLGALRHPGAWTILLLAMSTGLHLGPVEIGLAAFGTARDSVGLVGVLLAIWGLGSMLAGFAATRVGPPAHLQRRLLVQLVWLAIAALALGLAQSGWSAAVLLVVAGTGIAPLMATIMGSFDELAPGESVAELYGLFFAGMVTGSMLGAPVAGALVDHASPSAALAFSAVGPLIGALLISARMRRRPSDRDVTPDDPTATAAESGPIANVDEAR